MKRYVALCEPEMYTSWIVYDLQDRKPANLGTRNSFRGSLRARRWARYLNKAEANKS